MSDIVNDTELDELAQRLKTQLGTRLQRHRLKKGMTQQTVAERADLSLKYLGEVERGEANPTVMTLAKIAYVLGWDPWTLFGEHQPGLSRPVHLLITAEVYRWRAGLMNFEAWLEALDPMNTDPSTWQTSALLPTPAAPRRPSLRTALWRMSVSPHLAKFEPTSDSTRLLGDGDLANERSTVEAPRPVGSLEPQQHRNEDPA